MSLWVIFPQITIGFWDKLMKFVITISLGIVIYELNC